MTDYALRGTVTAKRYALLGAKAAEALKARRFDAWYFDSPDEAAAKLISLIPASDTVAWGGSFTVDALGVKRLVREKGLTVIDRDAARSPEEKEALSRAGLTCGTYLMGCNALSEDGELVNVDAFGNRVAALCFGPRQVIVIAGMNKVVKSLKDAYRRARTIAAPVNAQRFVQGRTPCAADGACHDCKSPDCVCSYIVTTRMSRPAGRIKVILVGQDLGF